MGGFSTVSTGGGAVVVPGEAWVGLAGLYVDDALIADQGISAVKLNKASVLGELPVVVGYSPKGLATDSTGVKHETGNIYVPSWVTRMFSASYLEVSLLQLTGGTVALEIYDGTNVIDSISLNTTSYRTRSSNNILSSIAGKEVRGRFNVKTAGSSGSVGGDATYKIVFVR